MGATVGAGGVASAAALAKANDEIAVLLHELKVSQPFAHDQHVMSCSLSPFFVQAERARTEKEQQAHAKCKVQMRDIQRERDGLWKVPMRQGYSVRQQCWCR